MGPTYEIHRGGQLAALVKEQLFTFLKYRFNVDVGGDGADPGDLEIEGDFWAHEYAFTRAGQPVAAVSQKWFTWADTYGVDVHDGVDDVLILACTVVVDMVVEKRQKKE